MVFEEINLDNENKINDLSVLASGIVKEHYDPILGSEQNDYMIEKFQSPHALKEQMEHGYRYFSLSDDNGEKVGFMAFYKRENDLYLSKFYLKKEFRGKGFSREMLAFIVDRAREYGFYKITLNVNKYNDAVYAYEKLGFKRVRAEEIDIGKGYIMDDFVYEYIIE